MIRVVVADDHAASRHGLVELLSAEDGFRVVSEAISLDEAFRAAGEQRPDVLLLDLNIPGGSSLDAIPSILERAPGTVIVIVTMQDDPGFERRARALGAAGYVVKDAADTALVSALHSIFYVRTASEG